MEVKQRLYELEVILSDKDFIRTSKSQINKVKSLRPEINRTISLLVIHAAAALFHTVLPLKDTTIYKNICRVSKSSILLLQYRLTSQPICRRLYT